MSHTLFKIGQRFSTDRFSIYKDIVVFTFLITLLSSNIGQSQNGLHGEYYDGQNFERLVATRTDAAIDFAWFREPPFPDMHPEVYSIRWTGKIKAPKDGSYEFSAAVDDGIRVWIDNQLIIENWAMNDMGRAKAEIDLKAGIQYQIKIEYFNAMLEGEIKLYWELPKEDQSWWKSLIASTEYELIGAEYFYFPSEKKKTEQIIENEITASLDASPPSQVAKSQPQKTIPKPKKSKPIIKKEKPKVSVTKTVEPQAVLPEKAAASYLPKTVNFNRKESKILESSYVELDELAKFLLSKPLLTLRIEGHTDNVGDPDKNLELSKRRAFAIASYLVKKEVPAKRIKAEGFGGSKPLVKSEKGVYHPQNRRVDFILEEN